MSVLKIKNQETGEWVSVLGPTGPQGPQGDTGPRGETGEAGYTPQRGIDYWTEEDIAEIKAYVDEAILEGAW